MFRFLCIKSSTSCSITNLFQFWNVLRVEKPVNEVYIASVTAIFNSQIAWSKHKDAQALYRHYTIHVKITVCIILDFRLLDF
jgi:hypothetical protein